MTTTRPTPKIPPPLGPGSPKLDRGRTEASVLGPQMYRNGEPYRIEQAKGRFVSSRDAKAWADAVHPDAEVVVLTRFNARDGWTPHAMDRRINGEWVAR